MKDMADQAACCRYYAGPQTKTNIAKNNNVNQQTNLQSYQALIGSEGC